MGEPASSSDRYVLVVDDDPQVLRLMGRLLEREGYTVGSAGTTDEAQALLDGTADGAFPLWLIDSSVAPGGAEPLLERARHTRPRPRVVLTSGERPGEELARSLDALGGIFLAKPFSPADFLRAVEGPSARPGSVRRAMGERVRNTGSGEPGAGGSKAWRRS